MASKNDKPSVTLLDWQRLEKDNNVYLGQLDDRHSASSVLVDDKGYAVGKTRFDDLAKAIRFAERDWAVNAPLTELRIRVSELGGKTPRFVWGDDVDGLRGSFDGEEIFVKRPTGLTRVVGEVLGYLPFKGNPVFDVEAAKQDRERAWLIARLYGLAAEQAVVAATNIQKPASKAEPAAAETIPEKKPSARKTATKPTSVKPPKAPAKPAAAKSDVAPAAPAIEKTPRGRKATETTSAASTPAKAAKPAADASTAAKPRGRKPSAAKAAAPAAEAAPAEIKPKRGPGRPRKDEAAAAKSVATTTARPAKPAPAKPRAPRTTVIGKAESAIK